MSADATQARGSTDGQTIVGLRSGTLLDPKLVAELQAVAARTDIAQRVLTILEPVGTDAEAQLTRRAPGWDGRGLPRADELGPTRRASGGADRRLEQELRVRGRGGQPRHSCGDLLVVPRVSSTVYRAASAAGR
jgi:hypothetical protein